MCYHLRWAWCFQENAVGVAFLIDREKKREMREVVSSENYFFPKKSAGAK